MVKPKEKGKNKIPVREPQKRTPSGIFDNLRRLPHPVEEILGLSPVVGTHNAEQVGTHQETEINLRIEEHQILPCQEDIVLHSLHETQVGTHQNTDVGTHSEGDIGTHHQIQVGTRNVPMVGTTDELVGTMVPTTGGLVGTMVPTSENVGTHHPRTFPPRRGDRHSPSREQFKIRPDPEILRQVKQFCLDRKLTYQEFFERASMLYIDSVGTHQTGCVGTMGPHDDMMIYKTHDDIIMLYRELTGNRWKPADDRAATRFNDSDRRTIEIGLLSTLINAKGKKINSFAYFIPEIEEALAVRLTDETLNIMLPRRRAQWEALREERKNK
jgi:hypothetical protein